ncbi:MAG: hypothetical protein ACI9YE_002214 [Psychroserpens sp.]|jgi:hypothetical protein
MKKQYFNILQILFLCLISTTTSFANKASNMSSSKTLDNLVLDIKRPASFTEFAARSCELVVPDYTTLAVVTGAGATLVIKQSPLPCLLHLKYELNYCAEQRM